MCRKTYHQLSPHRVHKDSTPQLQDFYSQHVGQRQQLLLGCGQRGAFAVRSFESPYVKFGRGYISVE
jgi:hypothetical protein